MGTLTERLEGHEGLKARNELIAWFESRFTCELGQAESYADKRRTMEYVTIAARTHVRDVEQETPEAAMSRCVREMIRRLEILDAGSHKPLLYWRYSDKVKAISNWDFATAETHVIVLTRVVSPEVVHWPFRKHDGELVEAI